MTNYNIIEISGEFRKASEIHEGCTFSQDNFDFEKKATFQTLEEAREELKKYQTKVWHRCGTVYTVTEYGIEEEEVDEDGEFVSGGDIWDWSPMITEEQLDDLDGAEYGEHFNGRE